MKKLAFTLAETLIVMGIIGVVAALTLPNLNSSTGNKEVVAKVKKLYSNLNDATGRMQAVYGNWNEWKDTDKYTDNVSNRLEDFLKISKKCTGGRSNSCFTNNAKCLGTSCAIDKADTDCWGSDNGTYLLADGSGLFVYRGCDCASGGVCFLVDIDGPQKGANTWGKDLFQFGMNEFGELRTSTSSYTDVSTDTLLKTNCFAKGDGCAEWIMRNDNVDYLKADRTGKCPNNIQLSWSNISCK